MSGMMILIISLSFFTVFFVNLYYKTKKMVKNEHVLPKTDDIKVSVDLEEIENKTLEEILIDRTKIKMKLENRLSFNFEDHFNKTLNDLESDSLIPDKNKQIFNIYLFSIKEYYQNFFNIILSSENTNDLDILNKNKKKLTEFNYTKIAINDLVFSLNSVKEKLSLVVLVKNNNVFNDVTIALNNNDSFFKNLEIIFTYNNEFLDVGLEYIEQKIKKIQDDMVKDLVINSQAAKKINLKNLDLI